MRHLIGTSAAAAAVLAIVSLPARAQDPVRLPGVKVVGTADKPGPRLLVGIVVDTAGNVIAGAEVTIPGLVKRQFTKDDGTFRFDSVGSGKHRMRARKIGYAPQVREFEVDSAGGVAEFQLLPIVRALPAMVSTANRRGLTGYVANMDLQAVAGANVRLLGTGMRATTDADGNFFIPAEAGRYMIAIEREDYTTKLVGVSIPKDSGRHVNAWLMRSVTNGMPKPMGASWIVEDLRERQAWTRPQHKVLYTREDLARLKIEWLYDAVAMTWSKFPRKDGQSFSRDCAVVVNGGPGIAILEDLTIEDVETVEIYASFAAVGSTTAATAPRSKNARLKASTFNTPGSGPLLREAVSWNWTRACPAIYVWGR